MKNEAQGIAIAVAVDVVRTVLNDYLNRVIGMHLDQKNTLHLVDDNDNVMRITDEPNNGVSLIREMLDSNIGTDIH